jgi:hypothetical protein
MVDWLQQNSPKEDAYEFLEECFEENGEFNQQAVVFALTRIGVFI